MLMRTIRLSASLLLSLLLWEQVPAQAPSPSQLQATIVRPDPKHAHRAAERGDKAQAAGRFRPPLAASQGTAREAPPERLHLDQGAPLRSPLFSPPLLAP